MSNLHLIMIGAHQRSTPVAVRERLAFAAHELSAALTELKQIAVEGCILSTCNRVEIYAVIEGPQADPSSIIHFLSEYSGLAPADISANVHVFTGAEVAHHASRLASGLDSMVLGEDQIVGQLKTAMQHAQEHGTLGQILHKLLQGALATGKMVRSQTGIARSHLSVVSVALDQARQAYGHLSGKTVLIVGAGQTGELFLKHLADQPPAHTIVVNRTLGRAEALAERYHAEAYSLEALPSVLKQADVVLCATASAEAIINRSMVEAALAEKPRKLLLIDLAVPRDIEPEVATLAGVTLVDVDQLQTICEANRLARASEIAHAEQLISDGIDKFMEWWAARLATPTIRALRERAEAIRIAEVERTLARMPQLSERDQAAIQALSEAIVNKLLHTPITNLKDSHTTELIGAAQQLFQINMPQEQPSSRSSSLAHPPVLASCNNCATPCKQCPMHYAA